MKCKCQAEISHRSKYCPNCGASTKDYFRTVSNAPRAGNRTSPFLQNVKTGLLLDGKHRVKIRRAHTGETATLRLVQDAPPCVNAAANPEVRTKLEVSLWEMFTHNLKLRGILESVLSEWPEGTANEVLRRAREYLRTHCIACGGATESHGKGRIPFCAQCDSST
jgi:hypothetical protein